MFSLEYTHGRPYLVRCKEGTMLPVREVDITRVPQSSERAFNWL